MDARLDLQETWANAVRKFDNDQLMVLAMVIGLIDGGSGLNVVIRQPALDCQRGPYR